MSEPPVYELVNGPDPCDICVSIAGFYPVPPDVPIHLGCECTVRTLDAEGAEDVTYEVRNVEWDEEEWTEEVQGAISNCGNPQQSIDFSWGAEQTTPLEHFDPGVQAEAEAAGWQRPEPQGITGHVDIAADCTLEFTFVARHVSVLFKGELWRVRLSEDPIAGVVTEEEQVDEVGGIFEAMIGGELSGYTVEPCAGEDDYFQSPEESPWMEDDPREIEV